MAEPILLTGGTGTLGRLVAPRLLASGAELRVLSRHRHQSSNGIRYVIGDLVANRGIDEAVAGVDTVVHCAGGPKDDAIQTGHLVRAANWAGVRHLVFISVVGNDRIPVVSAVDRMLFGYFAAKRAAERIVADSGLEWTVLRATQFHDFVATVARQLAKLPVMPVFGGTWFQPIDAADVAARLVDLALDKPAGLVPELGGPRLYPMSYLARTYLWATGRSRPILPITLPGRAARAIRAGANLTPQHAVGQRTWEQFLTSL